MSELDLSALVLKVAEKTVKESIDAKRDEGGSVLPEAKGTEGKKQRVGNLPKLNRAKSRNGKAPKGKLSPEEAAERRENLKRLDYFRKYAKPGEGIPTPESSIPARALALEFKVPQGLERPVNKTFVNLLAKRMQLYQCDGLDALHDMAMMDIDGNDKLAQWKYQAAALLATGIRRDDGSATNELQGVLLSLNKAYRENAPRIKAVRERVIEFETGDPSAVVEAALTPQD